MQAILEKLFDQDGEQAMEKILSTYQHQEFAIVNFIYFSNIVAHQLLEK